MCSPARTSPRLAVRAMTGNVKAVAGALTRFRVMAYVVGVMLLILVVGMIAKYAFDQPTIVEVVGPIHGFLYVIYLITVIDLAVKVKFSVVRTLLVMIAGTIPFVSFIAEHIVARDVKAMIAAPAAAAAPAAG